MGKHKRLKEHPKPAVNPKRGPTRGGADPGGGLGSPCCSVL